MWLLLAEATVPQKTPTPGAYKQCGGLSGGGCEKTKTCRDGPWAGATCPKGFSCFKANKFFW